MYIVLGIFGGIKASSQLVSNVIKCWGKQIAMFSPPSFSSLPLTLSYFNFLEEGVGWGREDRPRKKVVGWVLSTICKINHVVIGNFFQILCIFNLFCTRFSSTSYPRISRCCSWSMYRLLGWYKSVSCDSIWEVRLHKNLIMYATDISIIKEIKGGLKNQP